MFFNNYKCKALTDGSYGKERAVSRVKKMSKHRKDRLAVAKKLKNHPGVYDYETAEIIKEAVYRGEMAGLKVKSHLESLMGTDVIKLNDREYMLSLQNKLMREYDTVMDKQEEQRSEKERRRQRRLYVEGLQDLPNIDQKSAKSRSASVPKSSLSRGVVDRRSMLASSLDSDEEECLNPTIGLSANPTRRKNKSTKGRQSTKYTRDRAIKDDCPVRLSDEGRVSEGEKRAMREKYPDDDDDTNTQRAYLMRKLKRENTVRGMYLTADLVLAAPVAEFNGDTETVEGSPRGSVASRQSGPKKSHGSSNETTNS